MNNAIIFASIFIKARYDFKYLIINFKKKDEAYLKLHYKYFILGLSNKKLSQQRVDSFKMLTKINSLIYQLQLSFIMRIHSIISIV